VPLHHVSPSNLLNYSIKIQYIIKAFAVFTASWPVIASTTNKVSCGWIALWTRQSRSSFLINKRPAVSTITTLNPFSSMFDCVLYFYWIFIFRFWI
jgi:hypothetical protein